MESCTVSNSKPITLKTLGIQADLLPVDIKVKQVRTRIFAAITATSAATATYTALWFTATPLVILTSFSASSLIAVAFCVATLITYRKVRNDINYRDQGLEQLFNTFNMQTAKHYFDRKLITAAEMQVLFDHLFTGKNSAHFPEIFENCRGNLNEAGINNNEKLVSLFDEWFSSDLALNVSFDQVTIYATALNKPTDAIKTAYAQRAYEKCTGMTDGTIYNVGELKQLRDRFDSALSEDQKTNLDQLEANTVFQKLQNGESIAYPEAVFQHITPITLATAQKLIEDKLYGLTQGLISLESVRKTCEAELEKTNLSTHIASDSIIDQVQTNIALRWIESFKKGQIDYVSLVTNCGLEFLLKLANEPSQGDLKEKLKEAFALLPESDLEEFAAHKGPLGLNDQYIQMKTRERFLNTPMPQILSTQKALFFQRVVAFGWTDDFRDKAVEWLETIPPQEYVKTISLVHPEFFTSGIFSRETQLMNGQPVGELIDAELSTIPADQMLRDYGKVLKDVRIFGQNNPQIELKAVQFLANHSEWLFIAPEFSELAEKLKLAEELLPEYLREELARSRKTFNASVANDRTLFDREQKKLEAEIQAITNDRHLIGLKEKKRLLSEDLRIREEAIVNLNEELKRISTQISATEAEIQKLNREIEKDSNIILPKAREAHQRLIAQSESLIQGYKARLVPIDEELPGISCRIAEIEELKSPEQKQIEAHETELAALKAKKSEIKKEIGTITEALERHEKSKLPGTGLRYALNAVRSSLSETEVNDKKAELAKKEAQLLDIKNSRKSFKEAIAKIGPLQEPQPAINELSSLTIIKNELEAERNRINTEIPRIQKQCRDSEMTLSQIEARIKSNQEKLDESNKLLEQDKGSLDWTRQQKDNLVTPLSICRQNLNETVRVIGLATERCNARTQEIRNQIAESRTRMEANIARNKTVQEEAYLNELEQYMTLHSTPSAPL